MSAYVIQALLRADRLYSGLVMFIMVLIIKMFQKNDYNHKRRARNAIIGIIIVAVSFGGVKIIDSKTQTPGINGRITTSFSFVLLDRIVWPNMEANYEAFPSYIKKEISLEDAKIFDEHNNNAMYQMAPMLEKKVGKQTAEKMYREMAWVVIKRQGGKVFCDVLRDILIFIVMPFSIILNKLGIISIASSWNEYCMSSQTPKLTMIYSNIYCVLQFGSSIMILYCIFTKKNNAKWKNIKLFAIMSVLLALWFGIGDGAPPNDRYALIVYVTWALLFICFIKELLEKCGRQDKGNE